MICKLCGSGEGVLVAQRTIKGRAMLLTDDERAKFAAYLRESSESDRLLAEQAEKMGIAPIAKMKRAEAAAQLIVAKMLGPGESQTLGQTGQPA